MNDFIDNAQVILPVN